MAYAVIRTDLMEGTDVRADLRSVRYMGSGTTATPIENGCVVKIDSLIAGEREIYKAVTPAANTPLKDIVIVASPELMYDERIKNLDQFINEAGANARAYVPHNRNIFSVTADALSAAAAIAVGDLVELQADVKLKVVKSATSGSTQVGKIRAIETAGRYTYYVIEVQA